MKGIGVILWGLLGASVVLSAQETAADRELMSILEMQAALMDASEEGAGEETLLLRSQRIAERYEGFLRRNPDNLEGWILCGRFLRSVGADARALAAFRKARSLAPDLAVVHELMGLTLADLGEIEAAMALLLRAVELDPEEPVYREDLGRLLRRHGARLEKEGALEEGRSPVLAVEAFEEAFRLSPNFQKGWQWAESFADVPEPDWPGAAEAWRETMVLADSLAEREAVRLQLARALVEAGEVEEARDHLDPVETPSLQNSRKQLLKRIEE